MLTDAYIQNVAGELIHQAGIDIRDLSGHGLVIWLTGLSGAGKTTIATKIIERDKAAGYPSVLFDGDRLRALFAEHMGHDRDQRRQLALTYGRLCKEVSVRGVDVVCATISMFHEVHEWNRDNLPGYLEIYIKVPLAELKRRDPKGLYRRAAAGELSDIVGIDVPAQEPLAPDLTLENCGEVTPDIAVEAIWALIQRARAERR